MMPILKIKMIKMQIVITPKEVSENSNSCSIKSKDNIILVGIKIALTNLKDA